MQSKTDRLRVVVGPLAMQKGYNQATLHAAMLRAAPAASFARNTIANYWHGHNGRVDLDIVDVIADVLGVDPLTLFVRVSVDQAGGGGDAGAAVDAAASLA